LDQDTRRDTGNDLCPLHSIPGLGWEDPKAQGDLTNGYVFPHVWHLAWDDSRLDLQTKAPSCSPPYNLGILPAWAVPKNTSFMVYLPWRLGFHSIVWAITVQAHSESRGDRDIEIVLHGRSDEEFLAMANVENLLEC
jgi:hypothetical protein